jgi:hypothetical protein
MHRYERKYLVPNHHLEELRQQLTPFVRPDIFAKSAKSAIEYPQYTVRSIYFDSPHFHSYYEKMEGLQFRKKLRIRGYDQYEEGCLVFLEIKRKIENRIAKNRALVKFDDLEALLTYGEVEKYIVNKSGKQRDFDDAKRFLYNLKRYAQKPANLIVYEREPYHGKLDAGVRITFDKNIRGIIFPNLHQLYQNSGLTYLWENHFILEIKYFTPYMPRWAKTLVEQFKLRHQALSKYAMGLDKHKLANIRIR